MTSASQISDEEITAFLDGEATAELAAQIEARLETDAELTERLTNLSLPKDALRAAFDQVLPMAPRLPASLLEPASNANRWRVAMVAGVALLAGLLIGVGGLRWTSQPSDSWLQAVAVYQSLYVPQTVALAEGQSADRQKLAALSDEIALDLTPLGDLQSLSFRRAQLLGFEGTPLVQIVFATERGTPIALCILPMTGAEKPLEFSTLAGLSAANWSTGSHGILLIGGTDDDLIEHVARQLEGRV